MDIINRQYEETYLRISTNHDITCCNGIHCVGISYFQQTLPFPVFYTPKGYDYMGLCLICIRERVFREVITSYYSGIGATNVYHAWVNQLDEYETCDYLVPLNTSQQITSTMFAGIVGPFVRLPLTKYSILGGCGNVSQRSLHINQRNVIYLHSEYKVNADPLWDDRIYNASYIIHCCILFCRVQQQQSLEINENVLLLNQALRGESLTTSNNEWIQTLMDHHTNNDWPWECVGLANPVLCLKEALVFFIEQDPSLYAMVKEWYHDFEWFTNKVKQGHAYVTLKGIHTPLIKYSDIILNATMFRRIPLPSTLHSKKCVHLFYCPVCKVLKCKLPDPNKRQRLNSVYTSGVYWNYLTYKYHCYRKRSPGQPASHRYIINPNTTGSYHCNAVCEVKEFGRHIIIIQNKPFVHCVQCSRICYYNLEWILNGNKCRICLMDTSNVIVCASCGASVTSRSKSKKWVCCRVLMDGGYSPLEYKWVCGRHKNLSIISEYPYVSNLIYNHIISEHVYS